MCVDKTRKEKSEFNDFMWFKSSVLSIHLRIQQRNENSNYDFDVIVGGITKFVSDFDC